MSSAKLRALSVPRHRCDGCGSSCSAFRVGPLLDADVERLEAVLPAVREAFPDQGLDEPFSSEPYRGQVTGTFLAKRDGFCVFYREGVGCTVHATAGLEAKPLVCQLFPLQLVQAEDGVRLGNRPTCLSDHRYWADGPPVAGETLQRLLDLGVAQPRDKPQAEDMVLRLLKLPDLDTGTILSFLAERPDRDDPPQVDAWLDAALRRVLVEADDVAETFPLDLQGPLHPAATVGTLFAQFAEWVRARGGGAWPELGVGQLPYFADVMRRMVFLRQADLFPTLPWALLCCVAAARWAGSWAEESDVPFGQALAVLLVVVESPKLQRAVLSEGPPFD